MTTNSFSHTPDDTESAELVKRYKNISFNNGINFSHLVLEALKLYETENLDKRKGLKR